MLNGRFTNLFVWIFNFFQFFFFSKQVFPQPGDVIFNLDLCMNPQVMCYKLQDETMNRLEASQITTIAIIMIIGLYKRMEDILFIDGLLN